MKNAGRGLKAAVVLMVIAVVA
ncbi:MAG: hypothetical protein MOP51_1542, partial [Citricoccus sp.]|nr:hypothetical protein [Citricoccus sp. WCRC_4]